MTKNIRDIRSKQWINDNFYAHLRLSDHKHLVEFFLTDNETYVDNISILKRDVGF